MILVYACFEKQNMHMFFYMCRVRKKMLTIQVHCVIVNGQWKKSFFFAQNVFE